MKILSLFDGMACGMIAMLNAGVEVESYDAYEIDKYAVQTATHNFPLIREHGDVFKADFTEYSDVDFLIGGSPCTYWSIAQTKNRETVASGMGWELFSQYVRALHEAKPRYFIYENNKSMSKEIRASINEAFGFEAVLINSALVSAQNRQRLYWAGKRNEDGTYSKVEVEQPEDRGILLKDILEGAATWREKSCTLRASAGTKQGLSNLLRHIESGGQFGYQGVAEPVDLTGNDKAYTLTATYDGACAWNTIERHQRNMVAEPVGTTKDGKAFCVTSRYYKGFGNNPGKCLDKHRDSICAEPVCVASRGRNPDNLSDRTAGMPTVQHLEAHTDGKTNTLTSVSKDNLVAEPCCMRYERTDEAKKCRKAYEAHEVKHGYHELSELHPRMDGKTNTLSTVLKDNLVCEPMYECPKDCEIRVTDNSIRCMRHDAKHSTVQGTRVNFESGKAQTLSPSHVTQCVQRVGSMPRPNGELSTSAGFRIYSADAKGRYLCANGGGGGAKTGLYALPCDNRCYAAPCEWNETGEPTKAVSCADGKTYAVYKVENGQITIKDRQYPIKFVDGHYIIRKLTVTECKRLQTVPEWYEFPVSNSQAYKMLGNGWTCDVITHLIKSALEGGEP